MRPPHNFLRRAKDYGLPIAMTFGVLLWEPLSRLEFCIPYLIFGMLFITFLKLKISQLQFNVWHIVLLSIQMISAVGSYYLLLRSNPVLASGTMICFLAPCATASAVIIGMLGGSIAFSTPYVLLSHLVLPLRHRFYFPHSGLPTLPSISGKQYGTSLRALYLWLYFLFWQPNYYVMLPPEYTANLPAYRKQPFIFGLFH